MGKQAYGEDMTLPEEQAGSGDGLLEEGYELFFERMLDDPLLALQLLRALDDSGPESQ